MRYLAIDPGQRRVGFAVGDDETRIVTPLKVVTIANTDQLLKEVARVFAEHAPDAIVVGLPLNMDGTEGPGARDARKLAKKLADTHAVRAHLVDERLSTHEANEHLTESGVTRQRKKERRDALAAAAILRRFLG